MALWHRSKHVDIGIVEHPEELPIYKSWFGASLSVTMFGRYVHFAALDISIIDKRVSGGVYISIVILNLRATLQVGGLKE